MSLSGEETCQLQSECSFQKSNPSLHPEYSPPSYGWHLLPSQPLTSRLLPLFLPLLSLPPAYP